MSDIIPGSPYYREGYQLSARELQDADDLARDVSRTTFTGDGAGSVGFGGFSFTIAPELELIIIITGQQSGTANYSWSVAMPKTGYPNEWEINPDGPAANYTQIPARELNNKTDVAINTVVRAWVSTHDGGMSLGFDKPAGAAGSLTVTGLHITTNLGVSYSNVTTVTYDEDDGFRIEDLGGGQVQVHILPANTSQAGIVAPVPLQKWTGYKAFQNGLYVSNSSGGSSIIIHDTDDYGTATGYLVFGHGTNGLAEIYSASLSAGTIASVIFFPDDGFMFSVGGGTNLVTLYGDGLTLYTGQVYKIGSAVGQTGTVGGCQFTGGIWTGGTHPGAGGGR